MKTTTEIQRLTDELAAANRRPFSRIQIQMNENISFKYPQGIGGWTIIDGAWTHFCSDCGECNGPYGGYRCAVCYRKEKEASTARAAAISEQTFRLRETKRKRIAAEAEAKLARRQEKERQLAILQDARLKAQKYLDARLASRRRRELMVANSWKYTALDARIGGDGLTHGEVIEDAGLDPAEVMMRNEEDEANRRRAQ
jgi:hypothetical protein